MSSARPDPSPAVEVRPARPDELERVGELTAQAYVVDELLPAGSDYLLELRRAAHRADHTELLVAVDPVAGTVLGTVSFVRAGSLYADLARGDEAEFRMLAVDPAARGRGVATLLVRACLDRARSAGASRVVICSSSRMRTAHRLYDRLGFSRLPERDWSPSEGVHLLAYVHDLQPPRLTPAERPGRVRAASEQGVAAGDPVAPPLLPRAAGAAHRSSSCSSTPGGPTAIEPPTGTFEGEDTSPPISSTVDSPQAYGSSGSAAAGHPGGDPHRGVEGARDDRGQPAPGRDGERRGDPTERGHLDHDHVGGLLADHPHRVGGLADRLVRGHRHLDPPLRQRDPQRRQVLDGGARLLGVLQAPGRQPAQRGGGLVDAPAAVGVDPDPRGRAHDVTDGRDPVEVVGQRLARARRP